MTVLVLDGSMRASLAMVRSLGRHNVPVHVGETHTRSLCSFSKYASGSVTYADPQESREEFIQDVKHILAAREYEMVFASREVTTIPLSYFKSELESLTTIPFPDWETMDLTVDKSKTFSIADKAGIPTPETHIVPDPSNLIEIADQLEYPLVVKPNSKTTWIDDRPQMLKVTEENYVNNFAELESISMKIYDAQGVMPLIQEYIPGDGYGVEMLCESGDPKALFMHHRLREYPISGGASTYRESYYEPKLEEPAVDLLEAMDWNGVAMVEFRMDERDGVPKLMEVNGRFWGSLPLAIAAGVEFPYLLYRSSRGESIPIADYEEGVTSRWLFPGDILWFASSLKNRPNRLQTVRRFASVRDQHYDVLSTSDPLPVIGAMRNMLNQGMDVFRGRRNLSGEVTSKS